MEASAAIKMTDASDQGSVGDAPVALAFAESCSSVWTSGTTNLVKLAQPFAARAVSYLPFDAKTAAADAWHTVGSLWGRGATQAPLLYRKGDGREEGRGFTVSIRHALESATAAVRRAVSRGMQHVPQALRFGGEGGVPAQSDGEGGVERVSQPCGEVSEETPGRGVLLHRLMAHLPAAITGAHSETGKTYT